jgi:hypothetical protein
MVRHPRLPFGRLWVPFLSVGLYVLAWLARAMLWFVPERRLRERAGRGLPPDVKRYGALLTRMAWILLFSGSYTLVEADVRDGEERVGVRINVW